MSLSLKESCAIAEMAKLLYNFLPGSGSKAWKGHISFQTVAQDVGVGQFWPGGSKELAITVLLERTLESRRDLFEKLILAIVKAGLKYRQKNNNPISEQEIKKLNGLILQVGFKFPSLWDSAFLESLRTGASVQAERAIEQELISESLKTVRETKRTSQLQQLKSTFYDLFQEPDRQKAGLQLEGLLNDLFDLFELVPRRPIRITGEQIDGSLELDSEIYLIEAKWEQNQLSEAPLLVFRGKVEGKSSFTRGIFIALNGFSKPAIDAITRGKQPNFFLMDGYDMTAVLEGHIDLSYLFRGKMRRLAEEGRVYVSAKELM